MSEFSDLRYCPIDWIKDPQELFPDKPIIGWQWEGVNLCAYISHRSVSYSGISPRIGDVIVLGAYRVRILDLELEWGRYICVRENWLGIPRLYSAKLERFMQRTWQKIKLTAEIWRS